MQLPVYCAANIWSATTIRRVRARNGLKPHLRGAYKLLRDPRFVDKLHDIVGLYLNPPEQALALSCDELRL